MAAATHLAAGPSTVRAAFSRPRAEEGRRGRLRRRHRAGHARTIEEQSEGPRTRARLAMKGDRP